jgi:hypothetical protein
VINEIGAVFNVRIEGDTDANLFYTDATNSRVGVGTVGPTEKLDVVGGNIRIDNGNLIIGTSGKGIDFSITSHPAGMTSELLADYEEGTWTPTVTALTGAYTTVTTQAGIYTKIGRQVTIQFKFIVTNKGTGATGYVITSIPFAATGFPFAGAGYDLNTGVMSTIYMNSSTEINGYRYDSADPVVLNNTMVGQITYFV